MANILVYIELVDETASRGSLYAIRTGRHLASKLGATLYAVLPCAAPPLYGDDDIIANLSRQGADKVILMTHASLAPPALFHDHGEVLLASAAQFPPALFLMPAGPAAADLAPRIAARIGAAFVINPEFSIDDDGNLLIIEPIQGGRMERSLSSGNIEHPVVAVLQSSRRDLPDPQGCEEAEVVVIPPGFDDDRVSPITTEARPTGPLPRSDRVVLAGTEITADSDWGPIERLAERLDATLLITPNAAKAGLNGRAATLDRPLTDPEPELIIAVGVHGSDETLARIPDSSYVVVVHPDKSAPLMKRAQLGIPKPARESAAQMLEALGPKPVPREVTEDEAADTPAAGIEAAKTDDAKTDDAIPTETTKDGDRTPTLPARTAGAKTDDSAPTATSAAPEPEEKPGAGAVVDARTQGAVNVPMAHEPTVSQDEQPAEKDENDKS